ncbi:hypothetical protein SAMN02745225_00438 [Ferrithrix thermotolerans DSM 19514]|uniref:Uncharacterized protein n=1 Tax=Ferrithrix thermotolerans DSM 19514 TaxID=1121881 RepID=A0A1M4SYC9_9ACTN|nr:hypothetical protein [Ferrithrix thermotolerans]SHE37017.1 hypothetical protein SAMN02745225_00438 [Ferrithrix thermotolerans DSM 19514]
MSVLLYIVVPVAAAIVAGLVFSLRDRKPKSFESGIQDFAKTIQALSHSAESVRGSSRNEG